MDDFETRRAKSFTWRMRNFNCQQFSMHFSLLLYGTTFATRISIKIHNF